MGPHSSGLRWRPLVSYTLFFSFIVSAFSGIALYLRPEGSLARWIGWRFLWLDKKHWEAVHIVMVAVFLLMALVHLLNNRRALLGYLRHAAGAAWSARKEGLIALGLIAFLAVAAVADWPPLSQFIRLRADIRAGKNTVRIPPPTADADTLTLADLADKLDIPLDRVIDSLRRQGIGGVSADSTLRELGQHNRRSPEEIFLIIRGS